MATHALITGSTSGIGAATARAPAATGARVVITGRDRPRGAALADELGAVFLPSELTAPPAELRAFAARTTEALDGRIDLLVNNAAVCPPTTTPDLSDDELDATLAVNVRAPHVLVAATPARRPVTTAAVAQAVVWLASPAAEFVHGTTIAVDGGIGATRLEWNR
ncbi:SDR family oxidoreductase [Lentzea jiangxiensis]|uniref:Short chain dehydrogenase n=1 Tax=Lentzea jiangxiensis TaxID=641025 RepID=A0A1H0JRA8_9PSEU|nr:SDR family oxidoreductase [Lentzea jiangxiensis]SDO46227.1 short chain dehydrogenase [Lentzea jiangxiensis]